MMKQLLVMGCVAASAGAFAQVDETEVQSPINGHYYRLIPAQLVGINFYDNAQAVAVSRGGNLATIRSAAENQWIADTFDPLTANADAYIGFDDQTLEGTFTWIGGEAVVFTNWSGGEPNNSGNEDVAELRFSDGFWNDIGSNSIQPAIMERIVFEFKTSPVGAQLVFDGSDVTFSGEAWGNTGPITYQWKKNGVDIPGENGLSLTLTAVTPADDGNYAFEATDSSKATISASFSIQVVSPGSLPVAGMLGLGLLAGIVGVGGIQAARRWRGKS